MKIVSLISGGIDSPIASKILIENGFEMVYVYFNIADTKDKANIEKVKRLIKKIQRKKTILYVVQYKDFQIGLAERAERYTCVLCKRAMYRIANKIAEKEKAVAIVTGENLGQVASQTLKNMQTLDSASKIPVLRPLLTYDKEEIINLANEIGTYIVSIEKTPVCSVVPKNPATQADIEKVEEIENKIKTNDKIKKLRIKKYII